MVDGFTEMAITWPFLGGFGRKKAQAKAGDEWHAAEGLNFQF
jgi:hypothetical protein